MAEKYVTAGELAALLRRSTRTVYRMTHDRDIPFLRVGREYLYDPEAVVAKLAEPAPAWKQSNRSIGRKRVAS